MKRTLVREEGRKVRFEEAYAGWNRGRLSQKDCPDGRMAVFHGPRKLADYTKVAKEVKATEARDRAVT
jgi:hypothetical protein